MRVNNLSRPRQGQSKQANLAGFTLVELSVLIFVIVVIVGLLSTALNNTQRRALSLGCLNNIRELQTAYHMYTDDNDDSLPLNMTEPILGSSKLFGGRLTTNSWAVGSPKEDVTYRNLEIGSIFPYVKSTGVYRCPLDNSRVLGHRELLRNRSYSVNAYLNGDGAGVDPRVKTTLSDIVNPSHDKVFVFIEEHELSTWAGNFLVLPQEKFNLTSGSWSSTPADRHNQGCHLSFIDGHVEYWRWFSPKGSVVGNHLTSSSKQLSDLRRLQYCVPTR